MKEHVTHIKWLALINDIEYGGLKSLKELSKLFHRLTIR